MSRLVRGQLIAFALIAAVALTAVGVVYAQVPQGLGVGRYKLSADFTNVSGLYPRAVVTYRGVDAGIVERIELMDNGARVHIDMSDDVSVPRDVTATIRSTSAIGEQYVDLVSDGLGPKLADGDRIPVAQTRELAQIGPVLDKVEGLLNSVPEDKTARVLGQLEMSLDGSASDISSLIETSSRLVDAARENIAPTTELLRSLGPLLQSQRELSGTTRAAVSSLASFTDELAASDTDLRELLDRTPGAAKAVDGFIDEVRPTLPSLLDSSTRVASVVNVYTPNLRQLLAQYPALQARLQSALAPHAADGAVKLDIKANLLDPASCISGYTPVAERRSPSDVSSKDTPANLHCKGDTEYAPSYRGARNALCPNDPARRSASPAGCGLSFGTSQDAAMSLGGSETSREARDEVAEAPDMMQLMGGAPTRGRSGNLTELLMGPLR